MFVASSSRMRTDNTEPPFFFIDVRARVEGRNNAETGSKGAFTVFTRLCSLHRCPRACGRSFFLYRLVQRLASEITLKQAQKVRLQFSHVCCSYIDLSTEPSKSEPNKHWVSINSIRLTNEDKETLMTKEWLNDNHISAAQSLLKQQHPDVSGLQPSTLQYTQMFDVHSNREFVQCLNLADNHWTTVSTVGCVPGVVNVYDSLNYGLTTSIERTIANLVHTDKPTITIQRAPMQLQRGGSDCGLFAIASATAICNGQSPENIQFDQSQMRPHLLKCLEDKLLMPFPSTIAPRRRPRITSCERIHVYCTCRLPDEGRKMVQCTSCTRWYHCDCMKISTKRMKSIENSNRPWYCGNPCHC